MSLTVILYRSRRQHQYSPNTIWLKSAIKHCQKRCISNKLIYVGELGNLSADIDVSRYISETL